MNRTHLKLAALLLFVAFSGLACDLGDDDNNVPGGETPRATYTAHASLAGTYWSLVSMTTKGEAEQEDRTAPPDVQFCRDGSWGMLHYGGALAGGTYQIKGSRLVLRNEDGSVYGDFQIYTNGNEMTLEGRDVVLRLRYLSKVNYTAHGHKLSI